MMAKGVVLTLLLSCVGGVLGSETAFSLFFNEITSCLLDNQIPPVSHSDATVRVMLAASQNMTGFVHVMECVSGKVATYNSSASPSHAFLKKVFGTDGRMTKLMPLAGSVYSNYQYAKNENLSCLATTPTTPNIFDSCLTNHDINYAITQSLDHFCGALGQYGSTRDCIYYRAYGCPYSGIALAASFVDALFMKCDEYVYTNVTITNSTTPVQHNALDWASSAFVTCGLEAYPATPLELMYLFPPSEFSISAINNITKETFQQKQIIALRQFCSNVSVYAECVKEKFNTGGTFTDTVLRAIIDGKNFGNTMSKYCQNQELVTSQVDCMVDSVSKTTCSGGVLDILVTILKMPMDQLNFAYSCGDVYKNKQCRIDKQLSMCEPRFAGLMEETMNNLLVPDCRKGGYVNPFIQQTDIVPCVAAYYTEWSTRILLQPDTFKDMSRITDFVIEEMGHFCAAYDGMLDCIDEKLMTSEKTMDVMMRKYAPIKSIRGLLKYLCGKKEVIKANLQCLMVEVGSMASRNNSCLTTFAADYVDKMRAFSNLTNPDDNKVSEIKKTLCPMTNTIGTCFKPSFDKCSAEAGDMLDTLVDYFYNSCMDPNYEIKSEGQTGERNGAGQLLPVLSSLLMGLLAFV